jgi:hypothetical protein
MSAKVAFDFGTLRKSLEHSDADSLIALYADDAEMVIVDRNRPPSSPMRLEGKAAIAKFWQDVCSRTMTHAVGQEVLGETRTSFVEECQYPDGCRVTSAMVLDLSEGRIKRHLTVQAWDEVSCATS